MKKTQAFGVAIFALLSGVSCTGELGAQGPAGPQGAMGDPGKGWTENGNDLYLNKPGSVGIGTDRPMAKLHVKGALAVDEDASLLSGRGAGCRSVTLDKPASGDLGDQLGALLASYRCLTVTLKKQTTWTWNKRVELAPGQTLRIEGESFFDVGIDKAAVFIRMDENQKMVFNGVEYKAVSRVVLPGYAIFRLFGVNLVVATAADSRPLTPESGSSALITSAGPFNHITLWRDAILTSEDVLNIAMEGTASANLSNVTIDRDPAMQNKNVYAVKQDAGWNLGPNFGFIGHGGVNLGTGVLFRPDAGLFYNKQ